MYELNICHLYPDLLNLYGDRGKYNGFENALRMARNKRKRFKHIHRGQVLTPKPTTLYFWAAVRIMNRK